MHKKFWIRLISLLVILFFTGLLIYFDNKTSATPFIQFDLEKLLAKTGRTLSETDMKMALVAENNVSFAVVDKKILKCTRDGIKCYDTSGQELWNKTFATTFPILLKEQSAVIVSEKNGRNAYVFNGDGLVYSKELEFPILSYRINKQGYSAIMTKSEVGYCIATYDAKGEELLAFVSETEGIFPTAFDISDDGRIVAVNYLDVNNFNLESQVLFYYTARSEGSDYADYCYAASTTTKDHITPILTFMENNRLIVLSDNRLSCMDEKPTELWSKPINCAIRQISCDSKKYIWIAFGEALSEDGAAYENTLVCWDLNGKELVKLETGQVTYLHTEYNSNLAVVGEIRNFYSVNTSSDIQWTKEFTQDVFQLMPVGTNMFFVGKDEAVILSLTQ